jgi:hypothetical protein
MMTNLVLLATPFVMFAAIGIAVFGGYSRQPSTVVTRALRRRPVQRRYFSSPF